MRNQNYFLTGVVGVDFLTSGLTAGLVAVFVSVHTVEQVGLHTFGLTVTTGLTVVLTSVLAAGLTLVVAGLVV
jgi:hypothetical protein